MHHGAVAETNCLAGFSHSTPHRLERNGLQEGNDFEQGQVARNVPRIQLKTQSQVFNRERSMLKLTYVNSSFQFRVMCSDLIDATAIYLQSGDLPRPAAPVSAPRPICHQIGECRLAFSVCSIRFLGKRLPVLPALPNWILQRSKWLIKMTAGGDSTFFGQKRRSGCCVV